MTKIQFMVLTILMMVLLTACGKDPKLLTFRNEMNDFCDTISDIDKSINEIDAESGHAISDLLSKLDQLDAHFKEFSELDFPEEYDFLESLADESSSYMSEAVAKYHELYEAESYDVKVADYAKENYARAYKRIQIILTFLHGEEPDNVNVTYVTTENE